ncbi:ABC transporter permease [Oscillibacter sp.]|uniref:ABC transporter permease n=1 Tax=Oscillibacter sp. TaxID=1945593 RepID=UPI00289A8994|nr:ABC transporter permease [Oscillibacter sp.]
MFKLMKLELKRNNMKIYVISSIITSIIMLGFIYLFAYAPHIDPDPDLKIFASYNNIISLFSMLSMAVFATLSSIMYTRFVIDEYKEKRAILLFSYPVKRAKILFAKLAVIFLFTMLAMSICNLMAFGIFGVSESIYPFVVGTLSAQTMLRAAKVTGIMAITAAEIGIMAMGIGFIKKSVPTTIVSAVLLSSVFCNIMFNSTMDINKSDIASIIFMCITVIAGSVVTIALMKKVNRMEVE